MSSTISSGPERSASVTELVSGIVGDVQDLGMQHLALFRNEIKQDIRKATDAASSLAVGFAVLQLGGFLICLTAVHLLSQLAPNLSLWLCYGIVAAVITAVGAIAVFYGVNRLQNRDPVSNQTALAMKEDAQWLTKPK